MAYKLKLATGGTVHFRIQTLDEDGKVVDLTTYTFQSLNVYDTLPPNGVLIAAGSFWGKANGMWELTLNLTSVSIGRYIAQLSILDPSTVKFVSSLFELEVSAGIT